MMRCTAPTSRASVTSGGAGGDFTPWTLAATTSPKPNVRSMSACQAGRPLHGSASRSGLCAHARRVRSERYRRYRRDRDAASVAHEPHGPTLVESGGSPTNCLSSIAFPSVSLSSHSRARAVWGAGPRCRHGAMDGEGSYSLPRGAEQPVRLCWKRSGQLHRSERARLPGLATRPRVQSRACLDGSSSVSTGSGAGPPSRRAG